MKYIHFIFVGPYAEWLVAETAHFLEDGPDGWNERIQFGPLEWNIDYKTGYPRKITRGKKKFYQYCCIPGENRRKPPKRDMALCLSDEREEELVSDWTGTHPDAELQWFTHAFAKEFAALTRLFGESPTFHWGFIYWKSRM